MQKVFVSDTNRTPLTPCRPKRTRALLKQGKAAVFRMFPFTIILKYEIRNASPRPLRIKIDPGSKKTGIAIISVKSVADSTGEVIFAAETEHRGQAIKDSLASRRAIRRSRRNRNTRYRQARFLNRTRPKGWLPPSLESRIANIGTWVKRLMRLSPIQAVSQELVRFDTQLMENPEISGVEYQQGTLHGYEVREYLLEKRGRKCAYCGKKDVSLEIEHIQPKSKGGSDRISNLTLACRSCNEKKGNNPVEAFLKDRPDVLKRISARAKAPLKDAAAVNATRLALFNRLKAVGLSVETGGGSLTKFNRIKRDLPKAHWIDAACAGQSTPEVLKIDGIKPLEIKATGHGKRQMCRVDKYGFPRTSAKSQKVVKGFQTGDMVKAAVTKGKKIGVYIGRIAVRISGYFNITTGHGVVQGISYKSCVNLHRCDGYNYIIS
jgi:5-methylcytosine-specific restriction endonuclease McrA